MRSRRRSERSSSATHDELVTDLGRAPRRGVARGSQKPSSPSRRRRRAGSSRRSRDSRRRPRRRGDGSRARAGGDTRRLDGAATRRRRAAPVRARRLVVPRDRPVRGSARADAPPRDRDDGRGRDRGARRPAARAAARDRRGPARPRRTRLPTWGREVARSALALATELPDAEVWATDRSPAALAVARANLAGVGSAATRIRLAEGDWFDALPDTLRGTLHADREQPAVRRRDRGRGSARPRWSTTSRTTRSSAGRPASRRSRRSWRRPRSGSPGDGALVVELDPRRADAAQQLALDAGFDGARVERDLTGRERVLVAHRS